MIIRFLMSSTIFFWQVIFEGVVGSTPRSDIAIDDVEFQENTECEKTAETLGNDLCVCNCD